MMTTPKAKDYLDKEIFVNRNIVTFRSLSRELGIHVNDAKNELRRYYDDVRGTDTPAVPTFLVSGEVPAPTVRSERSCENTAQRLSVDSAMDLDLEFEEDREVDVVHQSKVLLVDARLLEETTAQFSRVYSVHVYSLSPARFVDAGLVCMPTFKVHQADTKGGQELFSVVGKITGPHVQLTTGITRTSTNMTSSSKRTLDTEPAKTVSKASSATSTRTEERAVQATVKGKAQLSTVTTMSTTATSAPKVEPKDKDKPKPSGKLDWSKAKTKEKESVFAGKSKEVDKKPKLESKPSVASIDSLATANKKLSDTKFWFGSTTGGDAQKRGLKRKPLVDTTDLESDSEPSSVRAKPSIARDSSSKKGAVLSENDEGHENDDDEESDGQVRKLGQRRLQRKSVTAVTSDSEASLRVMMDIDDELVDRASKGRLGKVRPLPKEEEEEGGAEEEEESSVPETAPPLTSQGEESEEDEAPVVVSKPRKPRKVVPVGRNGLKKRRIVKRRTTTDAKGYMQTEDYTSYESVDEEEVETKPESKGKGKEAKRASEPSTKVDETKPKVGIKEAEGSGKQTKGKSALKARGGAPKRGGLLNFFGPEKGRK